MGKRATDAEMIAERYRAGRRFDQRRVVSCKVNLIARLHRGRVSDKGLNTVRERVVSDITREPEAEVQAVILLQTPSEVSERTTRRVRPTPRSSRIADLTVRRAAHRVPQ